MSSDYRAICLSHDPGIEIDGEHRTLDDAVAALVTEGEHPQCDIVIGQYSYPLVVVWCPPGCRPEFKGNGHRDAKPWEESHLNLIYRAWALVCDPARDAIRGEPLTGDLAPALRRATGRELRYPCWTGERLARLRLLLRDEG